MIDGPPHVWMAWRRAARSVESGPAWAVADELLSGDRSLLSAELQDSAELAGYRYRAAAPSPRYASVVVVQGAAGPGQTPSTIEKALADHVAALAARKLTAADVESAKHRVRSRVLQTMSAPDSCAALVAQMMVDPLSAQESSARELDAFLTGIAAVTLESVEGPLAQTIRRPPDFIVSAHSAGALGGVR
jgi:predicted Zn-dependent peptidase